MRGYECTISDVPDRLVCKICHLPSRDPHLSVCCGHIFCKSCVDTVKDSTHSDCPMCRDEEFSTVLNKQADREVKGLKANCTNSGIGCTWRGEVRALLAHAKSCDYEMVQCEYHEIGCTEKVHRNKLKDHNKESVEKHLALSMKKVKHLEHFTHQLHQLATSCVIRNWSSQLDGMSKLSKSSSDLVCPFICKVPEFCNKKSNDEVWYSNEFFSHDQGYKMYLSVYVAGEGDAKGTFLSVYLHLTKGPHDDELTWPLKEKFEVKLLNQISDCQHHSDTIDYDDEDAYDGTVRVTVNKTGTNGWGCPEFISDARLNKVTPTCLYLKNDCIFFQVCKL